MLTLYQFTIFLKFKEEKKKNGAKVSLRVMYCDNAPPLPPLPQNTANQPLHSVQRTAQHALPAAWCSISTYRWSFNGYWIKKREGEKYLTRSDTRHSAYQYPHRMHLQSIVARMLSPSLPPFHSLTDTFFSSSFFLSSSKKKGAA